MPTENQDTLAGIGRLIAGRYRLERKLGGGAMGTVWYATDELLHRPVAVKEVKLAPGMPEEEAAELRERALREARAIAVLSHPNVVTLYDVAREQDEPFVVMELVPSQSLAVIIDDHGALAEVQLAVIADGVAAGLDAAHRAGIVHRDVKPGNVLIGDDGRLKVSDFGISRNVAEHTLTNTGILLGTPAYIAPEVAAGEAVTSAADLWGLGATLFAAAEGRPPYDVGDDPLATVTEVVRGPVPVLHRPGVVGDVIRALMVKDPAQRMPLTEVRRRLQHLLPEPGARPFEMLLDPDAPTVRVRQRVLQHTSQEQPSAPPAPQLSGSAPLASDPGPPPFTLADPPKERRRPMRAFALVVAALVLFAAALLGSFAVTRLLAGESLLPERNPLPSTSDPAPSLPALTSYSQNAKHTAAPSGGEFTIMAPAGWRTFQSERNDIANNSVVAFVSGDGGTEVAVQRYGDYFANGKTLDSYEAKFAQAIGGPAANVRVHGFRTVGDTRRVGYATTVQQLLNGPAKQITRTTEAALKRSGDDLWIVRVTSESDQVNTVLTLFDRVLPTFKPTS
ncbi:serine/threonine-protein kinase [Saccharopolyspora mangrovi]|uniref:non-specific serine/threonine protein kinase n=1 Tax=Saccharopolyspora mangrovi TaxID=3082379 RepID=A0ABU6A9N0_9PSEU|nr:protein kinase [Saccharopolyspora sp. S2-29]MEB3368099.1 protein kinase [Saccharopolyspora sp. S2-29]